MASSTPSQAQRAALKNAIWGCLFGSALGDAMGLSTEFLTKQQAHDIYGPVETRPLSFSRIHQDAHRKKWIAGDFTDDTDQQMILLAALVSDGTGSLDPAELGSRLAAWARTGFLTLRKPSLGIGGTVGAVLTHFSPVPDPYVAAMDVWERHDRNLAANGAVMRTAVVGCSEFWDEEVVFGNAVKAARVTHADPRCVFSCVVVSVLVSRIIRQAVGMDAPPRIVSPEDQANPPVHISSGDDPAGRFRLPEDVRRRTPLSLWDHASALWRPTEAQQWNAIFTEFGKRMSSTRTIVQTSSSAALASQPPHPQSQPPLPSSSSSSTSTSLPPYPFPGPDSTRTSQVRSIVDSYIPVLTMHRSTASAAEIESHCFPPSISDLGLDDPSTRGYTLKCLGSALYCYTRSPSSSSSSGEDFKALMQGLIMEAGDADTNATVAGALVGCRVGYDGLPEDWLMGLRNREWIEERAEALLEMVLSRWEKVGS
ncbi:hypothetical protein HKX48_004408 [Thoreauomyces humboldtii]|nr:hypothetical protein HKX48_004408 [Thoreauomyces humboldtii]